jgi:AcrR family transcriptional regulator
MAPTRTRTETKRERTRTALLAAAHRLMTDKGVEATSLIEITDAADVAAGTFYNYFQSKEDVAAQVLDCVIANLGRRNDAAMRSRGPMTAVETIALSSRCAMRELLTNPIWYWWLQRPDLLVERMRIGFAPLGLRDLAAASAAGAIAAPRGDLATAWSLMTWQYVGGARDIGGGHRPARADTAIVEGVMQGLGVAPAEAARLCRGRLPTYPAIPIDFAFVLAAEARAA